ncbi:hypothetical protein HYQ46_002978 [Verticillium longisporum]|nr:hypothetical protein HYQ46_002978 [Verticillium longisporum]
MPIAPPSKVVTPLPLPQTSHIRSSGSRSLCFGTRNITLHLKSRSVFLNNHLSNELVARAGGCRQYLEGPSLRAA